MQFICSSGKKVDAFKSISFPSSGVRRKVCQCARVRGRVCGIVSTFESFWSHRLAGKLHHARGRQVARFRSAQTIVPAGARSGARSPVRNYTTRSYMGQNATWYFHCHHHPYETVLRVPAITSYVFSCVMYSFIVSLRLRKRRVYRSRYL